MTDHPILFTGAMVRAILDGRKTQTRRIVKPSAWVDEGDCDYTGQCVKVGESIDLRRCPYGQPGDRLWVRETCAVVPSTAYRCSEGVQQTVCPTDPDWCAVYKAGWDRSSPQCWRPSIHMPRWASRITLEIASVRCERLNEISEADAKAEGADALEVGGEDGESMSDWSHREGYARLWDTINGPGSWASNPWVWVVAFRRAQA